MASESVGSESVGSPRQTWTEPGAFEVAPDVFRIPLPIEVPGLHAVNVYVLRASTGLTVIDSGWADAASRELLAAGLRHLGHELADIEQFVVTHAHWDHYTQAVALRQELGVPIRLGRGERPSIDGFDTGEVTYPAQVAALRRAGAPDLAERVALIRPTAAERAIAFELPDGWLDHEETLAPGSHALQVLDTPGHTRGHIVLRDARAGLLFAGDHILPHITPSLAFERVPEPRPLRSYLDSLALVRDLPDLRLLPAHGPVTESVHLRVDELLAHHAQRLEASLVEVARGRHTALEVAAALTWTRRERSFADLDFLNQMMATLEIRAHLDVLAESGLLTVAEVDGVDLFQAA